MAESQVQPPGFFPPPPGVQTNFVNPEQNLAGLVPLIYVFVPALRHLPGSSNLYESTNNQIIWLGGCGHHTWLALHHRFYGVSPHRNEAGKW